MSGMFVFTIIAITINTISAYYSSSQSTLQTLRTIHSLFTSILIIRISSFSQKQLSSIYQPPSSSPHITNTCKICNRIKPPRYYHCRVCNYCIFQMDHHCNWLNCCVGYYNANMYILVLVNMVGLGLWTVLALLVYRDVWQGIGKKISKILLLILATFTIFQSYRMLSSFYSNIKDNQTLVETYKYVHGNNSKTIKQRLQQDIYGASSKSFYFYYRLLLPVIVPTTTTNKDMSDKNNIRILDIYQPVYSNDSNQVKNGKQKEQYTYADEYLYGPDHISDQQQEQMQKVLGNNKGQEGNGKYKQL